MKMPLDIVKLRLGQITDSFFFRTSYKLDMLLLTMVYIEVQQLTNFAYSIIESMLPSFSEDSVTIGEDSSYFLCTCGAEFELIHHYQQHLQKAHNLKDATIKPEKKVIGQVFPPFDTIKTQQAAKMLDNEAPKIEDQTEDITTTPHPRMRSKKQRKTAIQALRDQLIKKDYEFRQSTLAWEGFKLIKNPYCHHEPYYCGNCLTIYFLIEDYIVHCIQSCQSLIHEDSSHTITIQTKEEQASEQLSDNVDQQDHIKQKGYFFQPTYPQPIDYRPFREIISDGLDHRKYPFFCGECETIFPIYTYFKHFKQNHDQKIGQSSSHIVIRCRIGLFNKFIYISPKVRWPNLEKKYYCICNPTNKLKMRQLVQHIKEYHKGVSPLYSIPTMKSIKKSQPLFKKQEMTQHLSISSLYRMNKAMIAKSQLNCIKKEQ